MLGKFVLNLGMIGSREFTVQETAEENLLFIFPFLIERSLESLKMYRCEFVRKIFKFLNFTN